LFAPGARAAVPSSDLGAGHRSGAASTDGVHPGSKEQPVPYFIYRVFPFRRLEKVDAAASFREASVRAKALRSGADAPPDAAVKVIFAADEFEAENLLSEVRTRPAGPGDDE
jgi:hypothetical protein